MALKQTLENLVERSRKNGQPARVTLTGGLEISVMAIDDQSIALQLARGKVYPSMREWQTVVNCLPRGAVSDGQPRTIYSSGKYFLKGKVFYG